MSCNCGKDVKNGVIGTLGGQLVRGFSAYEIAVLNGFKGSEEDWLDTLKDGTAGRITSLTDTKLAAGNIIEAVGNATYYEDVSAFAAYGIAGSGWYVFARIKAPGKIKVSADTTVEGAAGYIATVGEDHIDVAVRFEVAALSQLVVVNWGETTESFAFKDTDLAIRNLDYRVTFYVYDSDEFAHFHFALATGSFAAGTNYYVKQDGDYVPAEVTAGETVPEGYYVETPAYTLTSDANFAEGTTYYIKQGDDYVRANVTVGDPVAADTYYVQTTEYVRTEDETFEAGKTYYSLVENAYVPAEVTAGETVPNYYVHSKVVIEGLVHNVTYRLNKLVDCPMEFILPEVDDDMHGCWFEIRCHHAGEYSMTLIPPEGVKIATEHTQKEKAGINMINLHYTEVDGVKIWRFMNTHSSIPA